LPIIADITTPPMPQEAGTVKLLVNRGAGILLERSSDIVATIRSLSDDPLKYSALKAATASMSVPNSTELIIHEIKALLPVKGLTDSKAIAA
jgi:UDP-N-acetylglucosamine:LPS N-acetylglucosamine transferase